MISKKMMDLAGIAILAGLGLTGLLLGILVVEQILWAFAGVRLQRELRPALNLSRQSRKGMQGAVTLGIGLLALLLAGEALAVRTVWQGFLAPREPLHRVIVYVSDENGSNDLWIMNEYGHTRALTFEKSNERRPRWSPDGQWILFLSNAAGNDDLYVVSPEGRNLWALTSTPENEDWASWGPPQEGGPPDVWTVLFTRRSPSEDRLCLLEVDAVRREVRSEHCIFTTDGRINKPSFSPNGQQIVFGLGHDGLYRLWMVDRDGQKARALDSTVQSGIAAWSPDGTQIAYRRAADYDKPSDLTIIAPDGAERRHIRHIEAAQVQANWSPDGRWLAFMSNRSDPPLKEMKRLGVVRADGTGLRWLDLGVSWLYDQAQSWQIETWDEHNRILYNRLVDGQRDLFLVYADGKRRIRLTETPANEFHAVFRPVPPLKQR